MKHPSSGPISCHTASAFKGSSSHGNLKSGPTDTRKILLPDGCFGFSQSENAILRIATNNPQGFLQKFFLSDTK